MKKRDTQDPMPYAQVESAKGEIEEIFDRAMNLLEEERTKEKKPPGLWDALCLVSIFLAAGVLLYGFYAWPDAPVRPFGQGYVGKTGVPHSAEEYESFLLWQRSLFVVFPAAFILNFVGLWRRKARV